MNRSAAHILAAIALILVGAIWVTLSGVDPSFDPDYVAPPPQSQWESCVLMTVFGLLALMNLVQAYLVSDEHRAASRR